MEFTLLHSRFTFPKFSFSMRSMDLSETQGIARSISSSQGCIEEVLGSPLSNDKWEQAPLPVAFGGFGLRGAERHGAAAYLASMSTSQELVRIM